jgi:ferredoxin--NADP+ reductase
MKVRAQGAARPAAKRSAFKVRAAAATTIQRAAVPLELEQGEMPLNTFNNKAPFTAKVK